MVCFEIMNRLWSAAFAGNGCVESLPPVKRAFWDTFLSDMGPFLEGPQNIGQAYPPPKKCNAYMTG